MTKKKLVAKTRNRHNDSQEFKQEAIQMLLEGHSAPSAADRLLAWPFKVWSEADRPLDPLRLVGLGENRADAGDSRADRPCRPRFRQLAAELREVIRAQVVHEPVLAEFADEDFADEDFVGRGFRRSSR